MRRRNVALRLFGRREQGKSDGLTGVKRQWDRERGSQLRESSARVFNQQRPLLILAAGADVVGSVRCVPVFMVGLLCFYTEGEGVTNV